MMEQKKSPDATGPATQITDTIIIPEYESQTNLLERHLIWALLYDDGFQSVFPEIFRSDFQRKEIYDFLADHYRKGTDTADVTQAFWKHYPVLAKLIEEEARNGIIERLPHYHGLLEEVRKESEERLRQRISNFRDPGDAIKEVERFNADSHSIKKAKVKYISALDLIQKEFEPIRWTVPGLIPEGLIILAGKPKVGKSWLALHLCHAVAFPNGGYALGKIEVEPGKAVYYGLEDSERRLKDRLAMISCDLPLPENLFISNHLERLDAGGLEEIEAFLDDNPETRLIVIDTLARVKPKRGRNNDAYETDTEIMGGLQSLAMRHSVTVLVVHHMRKNVKDADDVFDGVLGSTGLTGTADATILAQRGRQTQEIVINITGRDVEEQRLSVKFDLTDRVPFNLLGDTEQVHMSETRKEIIKYLEEHGATTPKDLAAALGKNHSTTKNILWAMVKEGLISNENGKYKNR
jgi:hypothetical protein